jgi:hypothetical protein
VLDFQHSQCLCGAVRAEADALVGHDAQGLDAVTAKEAHGLQEKFQAGAPCFIRQNFRIGQPGVIIDGQMAIFPALAAFLAASRCTLSGMVSRDAMSDPL